MRVITTLLTLVQATPPDTTLMPSPPRTRAGAEFRIPLGSLLVPGLGQYLYGAPVAGGGLTATAVGGTAMYLTGDTAAVTASDLPRHLDGQRAIIGAQLYLTAGGLSAHDAFHRALPALRAEGKYRFLTAHDPTASLLTAPFDPKFLGRWTTWADLAFTALVAAILVDAETDRGELYEPFRMRDAAFAGALSWNAGVGEEALFRGWLYPLFHETFGRRFWLSNGAQAALFGALHPQAGRYAVVIGAWAFYEGWLTRRNGWSIRESIFHHFWYDVVIVTATFLTDERGGGASVTVMFPPIRF